MGRSAPFATALLLAVVPAAGCGWARAEGAAEGGCDVRFGASPSLAARAAAERCNADAAGAACDPTMLLSFEAARCNAARRYPKRDVRGGLYYDVIVHRPVYRLHTALEPADGTPARPHRHLLLDARTGRLLAMYRADPERSTVRRVTPDGGEQPVGRYAAFWVLGEDRLMGFDVKAGKRFAEAYKVAGRLPDEGLPFAAGERFALPVRRMVEGESDEATADASVEGEPSGTNLRVIVPLPDGGRLELDLVAAETSDDQHGGY